MATKYPATYKVFNHRRYALMAHEWTKRQAEKRANLERRVGCSVRIVGHAGSWTVYKEGRWPS